MNNVHAVFFVDRYWGMNGNAGRTPPHRRTEVCLRQEGFVRHDGGDLLHTGTGTAQSAGEDVRCSLRSAESTRFPSFCTARLRQ